MRTFYRLFTLTVLAVGMVLIPGAAQAAQGTPPPTCLYERWYPGADVCDGQPWVISTRQECRQLRQDSPRQWARDPVCRDLAREDARRAWRLFLKHRLHMR